MSQVTPGDVRESVREYCRQHHIKRLALFGSVPRGEACGDSDLDVLLEFEPGHVPGLTFIRMQDELSQLFGGRRVDRVTPEIPASPHA
jgi:predicted nucleotidyltransferase